MIVILLLVGVGIGVYRLRIRNIKDRNRRLERVVNERTAALKQEVEQRIAAEESLHRIEMENVVAAERSKLARDLHDSVTQSLYSLTLFIEATRGLSESGDLNKAKYGLTRGADTAVQALKEMRLLVYELRPLALRETGLIGAIQYRLDAVENRAGVKTQMFVDGDNSFQLPDIIEKSIFWITLEALNNALKHAHATSIIVRIKIPTESQGVELEVSDNGLGFNYEEAKEKGGLGLKSMLERAEEINAYCILKTAPEEGTIFKLMWENK